MESKKNGLFIFLSILLILLVAYIICDKFVLNKNLNCDEINSEPNNTIQNSSNTLCECENENEDEKLKKYGIYFSSSDSLFKDLIGKYQNSKEKKSFFELKSDGTFNFSFALGDGNYEVGNDTSYKIIIIPDSNYLESVHLYFLGIDKNNLKYSFVGNKNSDGTYSMATIDNTPVSDALEYVWKVK